jgi:hypothetical protein
MPQSMDLVELVGGEVLWAHSRDVCIVAPCSIHSPSDHHMVTWPQHWRWAPPFDFRGIMERTCPHGIGHPDPDDVKIVMGLDEGVHGCDGCCMEPSESG